MAHRVPTGPPLVAPRRAPLQMLTIRQPVRIVTGIASLLVAASVTVVVLRGVESRSVSGEVESWDPLVLTGAIEAERYEELRGMAYSADAVVVGTIDSVTQGHAVMGDGDPDDILQHASVNLRVTEIVAGDSPEEVSIQEPSVESEIAQLSQDLSGVQGVFFLREISDPGDVVDEGAPAGPVRRLVSSQGVILESSVPETRGRAVLPLWRDEGFPDELRGRSWDGIVRQLRKLASER